MKYFFQESFIILKRIFELLHFHSFSFQNTNQIYSASNHEDYFTSQKLLFLRKSIWREQKTSITVNSFNYDKIKKTKTCFILLKKNAFK